MRYRQWQRSDWNNFISRRVWSAGFVPAKFTALKDTRIVDSGAVDLLQNSIAERCTLTGNLVLAANSPQLDWFANNSSLVIFGCGPTAVFGCSLALLLGLKVIHLRSSDSVPMQPLAGAARRIVAPEFYEGTWAGEGILSQWSPTHPWSWDLPNEGPNEVNEIWAALSLREMYFYAEGPSSKLATDWLDEWIPLRDALSDQYVEAIIPASDLVRNADGERPEYQRLDAVDHALNRLGRPKIGLVLFSQFSSGERVCVPEAKPQYTSCKYWAADEPWRTAPALLVTGGGDGALQDFLRAAWNWDAPSQAMKELNALFVEDDRIRLLKIIDLLDERWRIALQEWLDTENKFWDQLNLKTDLAPLAALENAKKPMKDRRNAFETESRQLIAGFATELAAIANLELVKKVPFRTKRIALLTPQKEISGCNFHNHLITMFTHYVSERQGFKVRKHEEHGALTSVTWEPSPRINFKNHSECVDALKKHTISVGNIDNVGHLLMRHGPDRHPLFS